MSNDQREALHAAGMLPKLSGRTMESRFQIGDEVKVKGKIISVYSVEDEVKYAIKISEHLFVEIDSEYVQPKNSALSQFNRKDNEQ